MSSSKSPQPPREDELASGPVSEQGSAPQPRPLSEQQAGFQRGRIVWGRPPEVVFRAGPLPRDEGMARLMAMEPHPQASKTSIRGSVAAGSPSASSGNIPQAARPARPQAPTLAPTAPRASSLGGFSNVPQPRAQTPAQPAPKPAGISPLSGSLVPPAAAQPVAPAEPAPREEPAVEVMSVLEPVVAKRVTPPKDEAAPLIAPVPQTGDKARVSSSKGKWLLLAGVAVVAIGGALWWFNREPASTPVVQEPIEQGPVVQEPVVEAPADVAAPVAQAPVTGAPVSAASDEPVDAVPALPAARAPAPVVTQPVKAGPVATPAPVTPAPVTPAPATKAPARPAPSEAASPAPSASGPAVVVERPDPAPTVQQPGPPPTVAAPTQSDPDAPVVTRPQRLD